MTIYKYRELNIDTEKLKAKDMPTEVFEEIFEICGADCAMQLLLNMQGNTIFVPTNGMCKIEKEIIKRNYKNTTASIRAIARDLHITEAYIRKVLSENKIPTPVEGQIGLFDEIEDNKNAHN